MIGPTTLARAACKPRQLWERVPHVNDQPIEQGRRADQRPSLGHSLLGGSAADGRAQPQAGGQRPARDAGDMLNEITLAMAAGLRLKILSMAIYPYQT